MRNKNIQPIKSVVQRRFSISSTSFEIEKILKSAKYKFAHCKEIEICFDKKKCFIYGQNNKFQIFKNANKLEKIGIDYFGHDDSANWPNTSLIFQGNSVFVQLVTGNITLIHTFSSK